MISSWLDYGRKDDNEVISDYPDIAGGADSEAVLAYLNHRLPLIHVTKAFTPTICF